jgi:hypothetical protein
MGRRSCGFIPPVTQTPRRRGSNQGISAGRPESIGFLRRGLSTFRVLDQVCRLLCSYIWLRIHAIVECVYICYYS